MQRKSSLILMIVLILALSLTACGQQAGGSGLEKVLVMRDWPTLWPMQMYYEVGLEKGFYQEAGLDVTFEFPPQAPDIVKLVGTGKAQFGFVNTVDTINAKLAGLDILVVGVAVPRDMGGLMYFKDSGMTSPADLAGKTVAIYAWPQTELHFSAMMAKYGMTVKDVNKVEAGDYSVPLMVSGQVDAADAAVGGEDLDTQRQTGREVGNWLYTEHGVPPFYTSLIITNRAWAEKNPELVTKFLEATFRSIDYSKEHPGEAVDINVENHPDADPNWLFDGWRTGVVPFSEPYAEDAGQPRGYVNAELVNTYQDFLLEGGLISEKIDTATFIDLSYLPK